MIQMKSTFILQFAVSLLFQLVNPCWAEPALETLIGQVEGPLDPAGKRDDTRSLSELMKQYNVPGVSVAVIQDFKIQWAKGYGIADSETTKPVTTDTLFQAASISKPVNAMAVLKAVQDGRFGLDDDINSILQSWKLPENEFTAIRKVTPRMLLSHTAGTDDGLGFPGYHPDTPRPTLQQIMDGAEPSNVGPVRVGRKPFTRFQYSGGGTIMMQLALMDTIGLPYEEMMQQYVLGPAHMSNSTFLQPLPPELDANASRAHDKKGRAMDAKWHVYSAQAAAGLWTTPTDLCKFAIELQLTLRGDAGHVLREDIAREMVTPVGVGPYGVGFVVQERGDGAYFQHSGGNWGFICYLIVNRDKGYGMAVMTNGSNGSRITNALEKRVASAYNWDRK